jgi:hypothetical protein
MVFGPSDTPSSPRQRQQQQQFSPRSIYPEKKQAQKKNLKKIFFDKPTPPPPYQLHLVPVHGPYLRKYNSNGVNRGTNR